jgi:hypothetical protein
MRQAVLTGVVLSLAAWLRADPVAVPNASFEQGDAAPAAWTMVGAGMAWERGQAADGERYVTLTGSGDDSTYWQSPTVPLLPGGLYRVSFMARAITAAGGTAVTGPVFCNRDIGCPSPDWTRYTAAFVCRDDLTPEQSWLRFGQWHVGGTLAFDAISLVTVQAVHARGGDLELGDGEAITGNAYEFNAPLGGLGLNHSRPLAVARCGFNTNRWVFGADSEVVYRHQLGARQQTQARVEITVGWYSGGQLQAEVSRDGQTWQPAGVLEATGTLAFAVPAALLPANVVQVRLKAMAKAKVGVGDSDPGSFQVHGYRYQADVDGAPLTQRGQTAYLETTGPAKGLRVEVLSVGDGVPGGSNAVRLRVTRDAGPVVTAQPVVTLRQEGGGKETRSAGTPTALAEGQTAVTCPYELPGSGSWEMTVSLGDAVAWTARAEVYVPEFYEVNYGEILPGSTEAVALWWAASGWKVPRTRPVPATRGEALLIRAAGNEAEAAQVVLRPTAALRGLTVTAGALQGPGQARLPAACLEVLNVRYVPVTQKTDATGVNADWPDPLPPLTQPLDLEAGLNQPLWVRVKVPAGTPAGIYRGVLSLQATGYAAEVPVQLEVYGFDLPKRMTCETAFGFDPGSAWDYQKVTDPAQRRQVLDLYWRNFSEHHIAPYNPAPLDPFTVTWPQNGTWEGGVRDPEVKAAGAASLRLRDTSTQGTVSARYAVPVRIPPPGLRLRFKYRTEAPGHVFVVTLNHLDAGGQWMSGRNNDMTVEGDGSWQSWDRTVTAFPPGAESVTLTLWATRWSEEGEATGGVWIDDLSVADVATGAELAKGGDFEPMPAVALVPEFGWAAWDRAVARGLDEFGFNTFSMPIMGLGSGTFHSRVDPELLGYGEATPEYQAAMRDYLGGIEAHLRAKGWLEEAFVYWFDEPDPKDYEFVTNGFRKLKEGAPGLRRMLTEQVEDALVGGPNLWCPISPDFNLEKATVRRREGEQFWWYVCTGPKAPYATLFIDHPGTEMRVWLWQTWERSIEGILVWQSNYWSSSCAYPEPGKPQNPYLDPMGWVSGYSTPRGTKQAWGNGDGRFIYPPEAAADGQPSAPVLAGPVDSIRWEMLRDGIEDYEYFVILRRLLQEKGAGLGADARRRVEELLTVPDSVSVDLTHFTRDPAPLDAHRHLLGQAITELRRRP